MTESKAKTHLRSMLRSFTRGNIVQLLSEILRDSAEEADRAVTNWRTNSTRMPLPPFSSSALAWMQPARTNDENANCNKRKPITFNGDSDMGLTIHYTLNSKQADANQAEQTVRKMRQLAMDLPFEEVGEIVDLTGDQCSTEARREELQKNGGEDGERLFWLLIQAGKSVDCPWNKRFSRTVNPTRIIAFNTWPGHGSEPANLGLCQYPSEIEWEYKAEDDQRFQATPEEGFGWQHFSWKKWDRYCKRVGGGIGTKGRWRMPSEFTDMRMVPTKLTGWHWGSFCKTQYASDPRSGGIPNFLRCHISVITLLDRIAKLPGMKVTVDDEGKYGPSKYSDDWKEAYEAGRKPTYRRHKGQYNPAALANEVGDWNTMIAGFAGALSDAVASNGMTLEAPIKDFPNFEQLEFKGRNIKHLDPFLKAMKSMTVNPPIGNPSANAEGISHIGANP